ncbi:MAG: dipeptide/oligopeptide/nickel ABC transporter ATP-binding protein, partial [bacterium]
MRSIEVNKVTKHFGALKALDDVSLFVDEGESFGLVGESGSGKTTLGRIILRLIRASSGHVTYASPFSRKDFQIVFQNPYTSLDPRMKAGEALAEPLKIHGIKRDLKEILCEVELDESYLDRYPHELSGGERQRLCIARAISVKPKFILLDEPVSSLDMTVQLEILKLLKKLRAQLGLTFLLIAHDLSVVRFMCGRIAVMKSGRIIEEGKTDEIFS